MKISNFHIKRPVFTIVTMFLVLILGAVSLTRIPLKLIPDINPPFGVVVSTYPGAGPEEVLEKVTLPLESSLSTLPGLKNIYSTSQEGSNFILLEFNWETDIDVIQTDVLERIRQTPIPDDANEPRFLKFDPTQLPIIELSLSGEADEEALRKLTEDLEAELSRVEGVANVGITGSFVNEVVVSLEQDQLENFGLSQSDIVNVIAANNISLPGEPVITGVKQLTTRVISTIDSIETLENLIVGVNPLTGEQIKIKDVSDVEIKKQDEGIITRANENPAVLLSVLQKSDANTQKVSEEFKQVLDDLLKEEKYSSIEANVLFDQGDYIELAIGNIFDALLLGAVLAMIVLFLFLRGIKSPIIIGIAIPYSVIVTFVLLYLADFTLNILTLGGLALGVGMLVDNSIVVIENIYRHISMGKDPKQAAKDGTKQVGVAITASTLTTIAVFVPVIFVSGIVGDIMKEFSLTIAFSLLASLFVAITVVPMFAAHMLKTPKTNIEEKRQNSPFYKGLERTVKWCLHHRLVIIGLTLLLVAGSIWGLSRVGAEFLPATDEGFFSINLTLENGTSLEETERVMTALEKELKDEDIVDVYFSVIGVSQMQVTGGGTSGNQGRIFVKLIPLDERSISVFEFAENKLEDMEEIATSMNESAELSLNMHSTTGIDPNLLSFNVVDINKNRLTEAVEKITDALEDLEGVTEVSSDLSNSVEEVVISVDREKALAHGFLPAQVAMLVNDITRGSIATTIMDEEGNIMSVKVEYDEEVTKNLERLKTLLLRKMDGTYVELGDITKIETGSSPVEISRLNQEHVVHVNVQYSSNLTLREITERVEEALEPLDLPAETDIRYDGAQEMMESSLRDLGLAFILAVILVYIVMAAQFESFKYPFVVMFTVPLMIIGVSGGMVVTNTPISVMAMIGIIVLAGIVVNNAIVIVDYINQLKQDGYRSYDAIVQAVKDRLRPVLMTALTTILGLIPLAIGIGEGGEINQPLGITVIGGLISSTFLTLIFIPVIYSLFDKETRRLKAQN